MQKIITPSTIIVSTNDFTNTIFYNIAGNFIPPEWRSLTSSCGTVLSKTSRQILSLVVSRLQNDSAVKNKLGELQRKGYYY